MAITGSDQSQLYAMCGVMRCGATRCGDTSALPFVTVNGVLRASDADGKIAYDAGVSISEQASQGANTATLTGFKFTPIEGQEVVVTLGSINNGDPIFAGRLSRRQTSQVMKDSLVFTALNAVDYTFDANMRLVTKRYSAMTADAIARDILTNFAPQLSSAGITTGLATIDEVIFTNQTVTGALDQIATLIGGYFTISYRKASGKPIVRLFVTPSGTNPTNLTENSPTLSNWKYSADTSQIATRAVVTGQGSSTTFAAAIADTTLSLADTSMFASGGGSAVTPDGQTLTYTGKTSLAAPGGPTAALSTVSGSIAVGTYGHRVAFVSASGETLAGTASSVTVPTIGVPNGPSAAAGSAAGNLPVGSYSYLVSYLTASGETTIGGTPGAVAIAAVPRPSALTAAATTGGSMAAGNYYYIVTFVTASGESVRGLSTGTFTIGGANNAANLTNIPTSGDSRVTGRNVYRSKVVDPGTFYLLASINNNSATTLSDTSADTSLGALAPVLDTASTGQVSLTSIPVSSDARVTGRRIYRSNDGGFSYKALTTIGNNSATTFADNVSDASLGDSAPTVDTASLGQISLTSIPTSGDPRVTGRAIYRTRSGGSVYYLLATIPDNSTNTLTDNTADASLSPTLPKTVAGIVGLTGIPGSGVGAITNSLPIGTAVNLKVVVNDTGAQTALAALMGTGDGIREAPLSNSAWSIAEATAQGTALLALRSTAQVTATYTTRDKNTRVGQSITFNVNSVTGTLKIQSVQIHTFSATGSRANDPLGVDLFPTYDVTASNQRYSLEDLLRQLKGKAAA